MDNSKKIIGAFAGKFLPPHIGHISQIEKSAKECDELYIVVCDNTENSKRLCKQAGLPWITPEMRVNWLREHFKNNKKIKVLLMIEDGIPAFPNGLDIWSKKFKEITNYKVNKKFADETYRELNEKYFPECEFVCFDRTVINISGTEVRNNPKENLDKIIPEARQFFENIINKNNVNL